ncbi:MAG: hypothetical protein WCP45_09860 [Verrucomicrobiota bacterium]
MTPPMHQQGNSIHPGNIQHFADSAKNAIQLGQRQFFTPPDLAAALCSVFKATQAGIATDLMAGDLALLKAAKRAHSCGIDVDERISSPHPQSSNPRSTSVYQADVTRFYPLAHAAGLKHDLLLLNPPFSLQWWLSRLAPLALSTVTGVKETYAAALAKGDTMDSTLATLLIALDSLSTYGEGFLICNGNTARRLIGDPQAGITDSGSRIADREGRVRTSSSTVHNPQSAISSLLMRNIWCWLDIPGAVFDGQASDFPTAVLYFSASHGNAAPHDRGPLYLHSPSADPGTVTATLTTAISARPFAFCGRSIAHEYQAQNWKDNFLPVWNAVREEYHQLHHGAKPAWNLSLHQDGTIRTFLDPFRRAAYVHNRDLLTAFRSMSGESPAGLVVQQASRAALKHAMVSGSWRVQPELIAAVDAAIAAYESVRAPFYTPNEVQSLGWLDEESLITCHKPGIPGFVPGQAYPLRTWIEDTAWHDKKTNLAGHEEDLALSGRELVVEVTDSDDQPHRFHVRRSDADADASNSPPASRRSHSPSESHHHIQSLIDHFQIPIPRDVAHTNPAAYQANLARLDSLQALINAA